jgi:pimeloyl-ACP methyl ester carboxylesterase
VTERAVMFGDDQRLGILAEPAAPTRRPCVLIPNSGLIYRVGPARLSVALSRSLAAAGFPAFRFDLSGLGDSEARVSSGATESAIADAREAMDHLGQVFGWSRFVLLGLCSGAVHAHHIALAEPRVIGVAMMDGYVYATLRSRLAQAQERMRSPVRLARGVIRRAVRFLLRRHPTAPVSDDDAFIPPWPPRSRVQAELLALQRRGVALLQVFTPEWTDYRYVGQMNEAFRYGPRLVEKRIENAEHLYLEPAARVELLETVRSWLESDPWGGPERT